MTIWLVAVVGGVFLALLSYRWRGASAGRTLLVARAACCSRSRCSSRCCSTPSPACRSPVPPIVALDVSQSWLRGGDRLRGTMRAPVRARLRPTRCFLRAIPCAPARVPDQPTDAATRLRPLVERALSSGRPLRLSPTARSMIADALATVPAGSRVIVVEGIRRTGCRRCDRGHSRRRARSSATTRPSSALQVSTRPRRRGGGNSLARASATSASRRVPVQPLGAVRPSARSPPRARRA